MVLEYRVLGRMTLDRVSLQQSLLLFLDLLPATGRPSHSPRPPMAAGQAPRPLDV